MYVVATQTATLEVPVIIMKKKTSQTSVWNMCGMCVLKFFSVGNSIFIHHYISR